MKNVFLSYYTHTTQNPVPKGVTVRFRPEAPNRMISNQAPFMGACLFLIVDF
jgi:hypothetical protein